MLMVGVYLDRYKCHKDEERDWEDGKRILKGEIVV